MSLFSFIPCPQTSMQVLPYITGTILQFVALIFSFCPRPYHACFLYQYKRQSFCLVSKKQYYNLFIFFTFSLLVPLSFEHRIGRVWLVFVLCACVSSELNVLMYYCCMK